MRRRGRWSPCRSNRRPRQVRLLPTVQQPRVRPAAAPPIHSSLSAEEVDDLARSVLAQLREQEEEIEAAVSTDIAAEMRGEAEAGVVLGGGAGGGAGVRGGGAGGIGDEKKEAALLRDVRPRARCLQRRRRRRMQPRPGRCRFGGGGVAPAAVIP